MFANVFFAHDDMIALSNFNYTKVWSQSQQLEAGYKRKYYRLVNGIKNYHFSYAF